MGGEEATTRLRLCVTQSHLWSFLRSLACCLNREQGRRCEITFGFDTQKSLRERSGYSTKSKQRM